MRNILLPTDFSANSLNAIDYAIRLFKNAEINFKILNIQKVSEYTTSELMTSTPSDTLYDGVLEDNNLKIQSLVQKLALENITEKFFFEAIIDFDVFIDSVQQNVKLHDIELIIMGSNGATGAKETIFGSNTLQVLRNIYCPLLIVPEGYRFQKIKSVLYSRNTKIKIAASRLTPLITILKKHNPILNILDITEEKVEKSQTESVISFKDDLDKIELKYFEINEIPFLTAIKTFQQLIPIDLHALALEKKGFIDRLVSGSVAANISYDSQVPLLVMHPS